MSRYRQTFSEALAQVEKWSKDVEVKSTGEHAGKTIGQLKKEVDALRGKPDNEKKMGGLLFAIRAKQGWKKGEGSTGVGEATQFKHERGEVKPEKAERGERKAGESEDDYEDRESGGAKGFRPDPNKKKKKQDDLDRDDEAQATRSKVRPPAEGKLPPHLAKFFDKKGNPNPEAAKRMADGQKKRAVAAKVKDVTPKGYGPSEEVEKEALDTWHPDPEKDRKTTSMKHTAKSVAHHDAQKKKPATFAKIDSRQAAAKVQDILKKQRERKAAAKKNESLWIGDSPKTNTGGGTQKFRKRKGQSPIKAPKALTIKGGPKTGPTAKVATKGGGSTGSTGGAVAPLANEYDKVAENLEFKVKIKGIPSFYVPAKTAAKVKQSLRKQLKHPDDIESITRVTKAAQKIDFRLRAQGKGEKDPEGEKK